MKKLKVSCLIVLLGVLVFAATVWGAAGARTFHLTILHANDIHGHGMKNLARQATLIKEIRAKEANVLVLNAGDVYGKGKYHYRFYGELEFAIMNALGTDALTLGNNEFKATRDLTAQKYLYARIKQARFPVLCANVLRANDRSYLSGVKPYTVFNFKGIKVGILGVATNEISGYRQAKGFIVLDQIATAKKIYPQVAAASDIVLALTHIGYKRDRALAGVLPGLAAIVGGHSHTVLWEPKVVGNVPIVQAGASNKYLGRLDLYFEKGSRGWTLKRFQGQLFKLVKSIKKDPEIKAIIDRYLATLPKAVKKEGGEICRIG
ncbi:MAG: metallophosphatase [Bacillota bacterium]|jgi:2',3'-cyclic-nucleotide 2'-phosphodiesterase (5'-nucleotidase family)